MAEPFENDESFLGYVEIHSQTPRALFHRDHVFRLFRLAGFSENQLVASDLIPDFVPLSWDTEARSLCQLARERLKNPPTAKIIPFPVRKK